LDLHNEFPENALPLKQNIFLLWQIANGQKQLKDIEDRILQMLANSQGNILDDEVIARLSKSLPIISSSAKNRVSADSASLSAAKEA
jgi:hypothetical protein